MSHAKSNDAKPAAAESAPGSEPAPAAQAPGGEVFEIKEVRYSLPVMLRELQLERTQSYFAKEIIDQVEISKIFAQARKERAKRTKQ
jgi:hypothetical protein